MQIKWKILCSEPYFDIKTATPAGKYNFFLQWGLSRGERWRLGRGCSLKHTNHYDCPRIKLICKMA